jgi:SAM-dependent methyltransferase
MRLTEANAPAEPTSFDAERYRHRTGQERGSGGQLTVTHDLPSAEPIRMRSLPTTINLGSGKDFRDDCLNIDREARWGSDIVADISLPFPPGGAETYDTARFGKITVRCGAFDAIIANDVLEHVGDLVMTMTNCLNLLRPGGQLRALVPYDLSYGAWQDPTHVRAFNERSWLYFTDWFWYLGWDTHRFNVRNIEFVPSEIGISYLQGGQSRDAILRMPRAIDSMKVVLEKIELSDQERNIVSTIRARASRKSPDR